MPNFSDINQSKDCCELHCCRKQQWCLIRSKCSQKLYLGVVDENSQLMESERQDKIKHLEVWFDERLTFKEHINEKINKAYLMLGVIKRNFRHLHVFTFVLLYKSMVRSHSDYCSSVYERWHRSIRKSREKSYQANFSTAAFILQGLTECLWADDVELLSNQRKYYRNV